MGGIDPLEGAHQRAILDYLAMTGQCFWRHQNIPVPIRCGKEIVGLRKADQHNVGMPDVMVVLPGGRLLGIEIKRRTTKMAGAQLRWRETLLKAGALHICVRSVDEVIRYFEGLKQAI